MKFKLIFNRKTYIIAIFAMLLAFFTIIINIIKAASLDNPNTSQMIVYASSSLICTAIIWLSVYSVLFSKFVILENSLILCLSVFREDIPYEKISLIRENSEDKMMLLYYMKTNPKTEIEDVKYVVVNISDSNKDTFVQEIRNKNKRVIYEVFTKNNKNDSFKED